MPRLKSGLMPGESSLSRFLLRPSSLSLHPGAIRRSIDLGQVISRGEELAQNILHAIEDVYLSWNLSKTLGDRTSYATTGFFGGGYRPGSPGAASPRIYRFIIFDRVLVRCVTGRDRSPPRFFAATHELMTTGHVALSRPERLGVGPV